MKYSIRVIVRLRLLSSSVYLNLQYAPQNVKLVMRWMTLVRGSDNLSMPPRRRILPCATVCCFGDWFREKRIKLNINFRSPDLKS